MTNLAEEWKRKSFHLLAFALPLGTYYCPRAWMLWLLAVFFTGSVTLDFIRFQCQPFHQWFDRHFFGLLRPHERVATRLALTGMSHLALGSLLTVAFFPPRTAITGLAILVVSDTMAALIGKRYGKTKLTQTKTLAGTAAFLTSAWLIVIGMHGMAFPNAGMHFLVAGLIAALAAALIELIPNTYLDDNLSIPLSFAIVCEMALYGLQKYSV